MKLVLVLCACLIGTFAGRLPGAGYGPGGVVGVGPVGPVGPGVAGVGARGVGADALSAADLLRNSRRSQGSADEWANEAQQSYRRGQNYGDQASRNAARQQAARQGQGQDAAAWDQNAAQAARNAARNSQWAQDQNEWARRNAADRAAANNYWSQGNQRREGRRAHDDIDYNFGKKFNTHNHEDGGYDYSESSDSHALDDYADRGAVYDRRQSDHAAQAAKADAQSADRSAAWANKAAASAASADKFGRDYDSSAWANGRNKELAQKLDASQAGNRYWSDARDRAIDAYSDLAARDSNAARKSGAYGDADGNYGYGVAGANGYAPGKGAYPGGAPYVGGKGLAAADYAKRAGAADLARLWDQSAENRLKKAERDSSRDQAKASFSKDQWLNDREQAYNRDQAANARDNGYSDWANRADQNAAGYDAKSADAASRSAAQQGRWDLDENVWNKENRRRNLSDRKANKKVSKKFFHNADNGGNNWERLNYDRDQVDDAFAYDAGVKKDAANRAADSHYNAAYDAAARQADAARAADASRGANQADWRKQSNGWNNAAASWSDNANNARTGLRNDKYKNNVDQQAWDRNARQGASYDRAADRYGADRRTYGAGYRAPVYGGYAYGGPGYGSYGYGAPGYGARGYGKALY